MSRKVSAQDAHVFQPDRGNVLAGILMAAIAVIIIGFAPLYLVWILIIPAVFIYWALRSRTTVDDSGITVTKAFGSNFSADWEHIEGVGFKGARTFLRTTDGNNVAMPGVTFNSIPRLAEASNGRIPDTITAAAEYADGKMEVIDREGNKVLMTKEEHAKHQAEMAERSQD